MDLGDERARGAAGRPRAATGSTGRRSRARAPARQREQAAVGRARSRARASVSRKRRAAARVSPVARATSLRVSAGCSASKARMTASPRSSDCTKCAAPRSAAPRPSPGSSSREHALRDARTRCWRPARRRRPRCAGGPRRSPRAVSPLRSAARTCMASSSSARSATSTASVIGAARAPVEPGARPDLAPRAAGDEVLEVGGERRRAADRAVDVLVAEHLAADRHAVVVRGRRRRSHGRPAGGRRSGSRRRRLGHERRALRLGQPGQHRIGGVGLRLVGEVEPGHDAVEQPAREHREVDVRRLRARRPGRAPARA